MPVNDVSTVSISPAQPSFCVGEGGMEVEGVAVTCTQNLSASAQLLVLFSSGLRSPHVSTPVSRAFLSQL